MNQVICYIEKFIPREGIDIFGKNSWMNTSIPYYILPIMTAVVYFIDIPNPYLWIPIFYSLLPLIDQICKLDSRNPNREERKKLQEEDLFFKLPIFIAIFWDYMVTIKMFKFYQNLQITPLNIPYIIGLAFLQANLYTAQIGISHQLMHKPGKIYKYLATAHLIKGYYMHFTYHHLYKHHHDVGTPKDSASALKGQNIYQFLRKSIKNSWIGVYEYERKIGKKIWNNYAILSLLVYILYIILVINFFGFQSFLINLFVAFGGICYLEATNYIEHYGLRRKIMPNGQYQKTTIMHSWNSPHRFSNYLLFKAQRHSDHHQNSTKPYQTLDSLDCSPYLPHGYTLMVFMSFFPSIFSKIMDPLVDAYSSLGQNEKEINSQVKQKAIIETRKFLIEISIISTILLIISLAFSHKFVIAKAS